MFITKSRFCFWFDDLEIQYNNVFVVYIVIQMWLVELMSLNDYDNCLDFGCKNWIWLSMANHSWLNLNYFVLMRANIWCYAIDFCFYSSRDHVGTFTGMCTCRHFRTVEFSLQRKRCFRCKVRFYPLLLGFGKGVHHFVEVLFWTTAVTS